MILHEVKRQRQTEQKHFTNDLIEDEYNELSDKVLGDTNLLQRNIIPDDGNNEQMPLEPQLVLLLHDLSKVDFTKIAAPPGRLADVGSMESVALASSTKLVPVEIKWVNSVKEKLNKVAIIGLFSQWRDVVKLKPLANHNNEYSVTVSLPLGVHKLLYIINNEYRVSEQLPTATDQEGIFFNWFEILDPQKLFNHSHGQLTHSTLAPFDANIIQVAGQHDTSAIQRKLNSFLAKVSKENKGDFEHVEHSDEPTFESYNERLSFLSTYPEKAPAAYSSDIPEMFHNYDYFKNMSPDYELPEPPQLPAHLNNVLLNKISSNQQQNHAQNIPHLGHDLQKRPPLRRADSSYYASNHEALHLLIPNHVILNHLMTTSIRNDVLTVACITRYSGKFVTQIMHLPAEAENH